MKINHPKRYSNESAWYTLFFAMFILPLMLLLGSISLDVAQMLLLKKKLQKDLDLATLQAVKFLPNREKVLANLNDYINLKHNHNAKVSGEFIGDTLSVKVKKNFNFTLGSAFLGDNSAYTIEVLASASSYPRDIMIYIDRGKNLAPDLNKDNPFEGAKNQASDFFNNIYADKSLKERTLITQQCFNPLYSEVKRTAIQIFNYFRDFSEVQIGLGIYPGVVSDFSLIRESLFINEKLNNTYLLRKDFGYTYVSTNFCGASAEREFSSSKYKFPYRNQDKLKPLNLINLNTNNFNLEYEPFLIPEEYIWMLPVSENNYSDISKVLPKVFQSIVGTRVRSSRGNLSGRAKKIAIFISSTLPQINNTYFPDQSVKNLMAKNLNLFKQSVLQLGIDLSLYFVVINSTFNTKKITTGDLELFRNFLKEESLENKVELENYNLSLIYSKSRVSASNKLTGLISMANKKSILRN